MAITAPGEVIITRVEAELPALPDEYDFAGEIRQLKLQVIEQAGKLDFAEADAVIRLREIQLQKAENEKLALHICQLETRLGIFTAGQNAKERSHE